MCSGCGRSFATLWNAMHRVHHGRGWTQKPSADEDPLHSVAHLLADGLVLALPVSLYVSAPLVTKQLAGPAACFSLLLAGVTAMLTALCRAELRSRWPHLVGGVYHVCYLGACEFFAYIAAILEFLQNCACAALVARVLSYTLNGIFNAKITQIEDKYVGVLPFSGSPPDLLAAVLALLTSLLTSVHDRLALPLVAVSALACVAPILFSLIVSLYHIDLHNWSSTDKFFPTGTNGMMEGAACFFFSFSCFDRLTSRYDARNAATKRYLYFCLAASALVVSAFSVGVSFSTSLLHTPQNNETTMGPLLDAFTNTHVGWMRYVLGPAMLISLCPVLVAALGSALRTIFNLATDGLVCSQLAKMFSFSGKPSFCAIPPAVVVGVFSSLLSPIWLLQITSLANLCLALITTAAALAWRYRPITMPPMTNSVSETYGTVDDSQTGNLTSALSSGYSSPQTLSIRADDASSDEDVDDAVEEYRERRRVTTLTRLKTMPSESSHHRAIMGIVLFIAGTLFLSLVFTHSMEALATKSTSVISLTVLSLWCTLVGIVLVARQPADQTSAMELNLQMPGVPTLPLVAIAATVNFISRFSLLPSVFVLSFVLLGIVVYVAYSHLHSHAASSYWRLPAEDRVLLSREPSRESLHGIVVTDRDDDLLIE